MPTRLPVLRVAAVAAVALGTPALAGPAPSVGAVYLCDGGAVLRVAYVNAEDGAAFAVVDWEGRLVPMRALPATSGAAYVAFDEQDGLRWRTKGDEGFLARLAPDHAAAETPVLGGCRRAG